MRNDKDNVIVTKSFEFAIKIIEFSEILESNKKFDQNNKILNHNLKIIFNLPHFQINKFSN